MKTSIRLLSSLALCVILPVAARDEPPMGALPTATPTIKAKPTPLAKGTPAVRAIPAQALPVAKVIRVTGTTHVQRSGPSKQTFLRIRLKRGTVVYDGNLVSTGDRSRVDLRFINGTIIRLLSSSTIQAGLTPARVELRGNTHLRSTSRHAQIKVLKGQVYRRRVRAGKGQFYKVPGDGDKGQTWYFVGKVRG